MAPAERRRQVVAQTADGHGAARSWVRLPAPEEADKEVRPKLGVQHLRDEVQVAHKRALRQEIRTGEPARRSAAVQMEKTYTPAE